MLGSAVGEDDVLHPKLHQLIVVAQGFAVDICLVTDLSEVVGGDVELLGADRRDREVGHVVPDGAVLERCDTIFRAEDPLLDRLGGLVPRGEPLNALQNLEGGFPLADGLQRGAVRVVEVDLLVGRRRHLPLAARHSTRPASSGSQTVPQSPHS